MDESLGRNFMHSHWHKSLNNPMPYIVQAHNVQLPRTGLRIEVKPMKSFREMRIGRTFAGIADQTAFNIRIVE